MRSNNGKEGIGESKKRMTIVNRLYRGKKNLPQSERMLTYSTVFYCMNGGMTYECKKFKYAQRREAYKHATETTMEYN